MTRLRAPGPLLVVLLFIAAQSIALTQQPKAQQSQAQQPQTRQPQGPSAEPAVSADEQQIRQGVVAFVEQYNAHKADAVAALFAADARMVFRDGTEVNGREEIKQSFEQAFKDSPKTAVSVVVDRMAPTEPGESTSSRVANSDWGSASTKRPPPSTHRRIAESCR